MRLVFDIAVGLLGLLHVYIMVLEMAFWTKPLGRKAFGLTQELAESSKTLAANQGLYNGFLAAGLFWGLWQGPAGDPVKLFFALCVLVAGVFGGVTASRKILYVQALPALVTLALGVFAR